MRLNLTSSFFVLGLSLFAAIGCQPAGQVNTVVLSAERPQTTGWAIANQGYYGQITTIDELAAFLKTLSL